MATFTLTDAWNSFSRLKRDLSDVPQSTFIEWMNFIATEAYHTLSLGCDPERFLKSSSYTAIDGSQNLPTDFESVKYNGCGFFEKEADGTQSDRRLVLTNFGSSQKGYYLTDTQVTFTGLPESLPVTLKYSPEITLFTALGDYFTLGKLATDPEIISKDDLEVIVLGLDMFYCRWDEDVEMEPGATQKYEAALNNLASHYRRTPNAYKTEDFSVIY
jgi:hypothetical protein